VKPIWSTKPFLHTVCEIEHRDDAGFWIFAEEFGGKRPWEWTKPALKILGKATELYMVQIIAESHF